MFFGFSRMHLSRFSEPQPRSASVSVWKSTSTARPVLLRTCPVIPGHTHATAPHRLSLLCPILLQDFTSFTGLHTILDCRDRGEERERRGRVAGGGGAGLSLKLKCSSRDHCKCCQSRCSARWVSLNIPRDITCGRGEKLTVAIGSLDRRRCLSPCRSTAHVYGPSRASMIGSKKHRESENPERAGKSVCLSVYFSIVRDCTDLSIAFLDKAGS